MKITVGEDWVNLREPTDKFKSWERRSLYSEYDRVEGGSVVKELRLTHFMVCHLLRDWSLDLPRPSVTYKDGDVVYENLASLDQLDFDLENELLVVAAARLKEISINFAASPEPESPTEPSAA